jgi:glyoxylase-like metal-dependent hydrolase (beta-lactamase superfamily II)
MDASSTLRSSVQVNDYIHHIDLNQYNIPELCSSFVLKTPNSCAIMDCGTSNDILTLMDYITSELGISLKRINYLIPTHYHFDHFGGGWKLWEIIEEYNPNIKILTTKKTKDQLQNPAIHMKRAYRTFGDRIGEMNSIIDEAFEIVQTDEDIPIVGLKKSLSLQLISTPGHTLDHVCPTLFEENEVKFSFLGESLGGLFKIGNLVILGSSMPPEYQFTEYVKSLKKIQSLQPQTIGLGHFGVIKGEANVLEYLNESLYFTNTFRNFVKEKFEERNETQYIVEQFFEKFLANNVGHPHSDGFLTKIIVALVYGQLIDLGLRKLK